MENPRFVLKSDQNLEPFLKVMLEKLTDEEIDQVKIQRENAPSTGLASEPVTITAAVIALTPIVVAAITRVIERAMENRRQKHSAKILLEAYNLSPEAGEAMKQLQLKYADVSITYTLAQIPGAKKSDKKG